VIITQLQLLAAAGFVLWQPHLFQPLSTGDADHRGQFFVKDRSYIDGIEPWSGVEAVAGMADQVERCGPVSGCVSWDGAIWHHGHPQRRIQRVAAMPGDPFNREGARLPGPNFTLLWAKRLFLLGVG
jgi:hypothetical protein